MKISHKDSYILNIDKNSLVAKDNNNYFKPIIVIAIIITIVFVVFLI